MRPRRRASDPGTEIPELNDDTASAHWVLDTTTALDKATQASVDAQRDVVFAEDRVIRCAPLVGSGNRSRPACRWLLTGQMPAADEAKPARPTRSALPPALVVAGQADAAALGGELQAGTLSCSSRTGLCTEAAASDSRWQPMYRCAASLGGRSAAGLHDVAGSAVWTAAEANAGACRAQAELDSLAVAAEVISADSGKPQVSGAPVPSPLLESWVGVWLFSRGARMESPADRLASLLAASRRCCARQPRQQQRTDGIYSSACSSPSRPCACL